MLLSRNDLYRQGERLFGPWGEVMAPAHGMLHALLELHLSVDVLAEHQLGERAGDYPMVVVPEWRHLPVELVDALVEYAKGGGLLVLAGSATAGIFQEHLGVDFDGDPQELDVYLEGGPALAWVGGSWQMVENNSAEVVGGGYLSTDTRGEKLTTATVNKIGNGKIAAIYGPYAGVYRRSHNSVMRRFLSDMLRSCRPRLMALFAGRSSFDIALRRKGSDLLSHISNTNGMQLSPDHTILDTIPPAGPIFSEVRSPRKPMDVFLEPWHRPVEWLWVDGELTVFIDEVPIHSVLVARGFFED
jgi:hypothetical protein